MNKNTENPDNENTNVNANTDDIPTDTTIDSAYDIASYSEKGREVNSQKRKEEDLDDDSDDANDPDVASANERIYVGGVNYWDKKIKCRQCEKRSEQQQIFEHRSY